MMRYDPQPIQGECASGIDPIGLPPESTIKPQEEMPRLNAEQIKQQALQKRDEMTQAVKSRASSYFDQQKNYMADVLEDVSIATRHCVDELRQQNHPQLSQYTGQLCDKMDDVCQNLRQKDAGYFTSQVQDFAKRRPGVVLGGALALGFLAVRFLKSSSQAQELSSSSRGTASESIQEQFEQPTSPGIHTEGPLTSGGTQYTI